MAIAVTRVTGILVDNLPRDKCPSCFPGCSSVRNMALVEPGSDSGKKIRKMETMTELARVTLL